MTQSRALRLGLVGAGRWGKNCIRTISNCIDLELAAVASSQPAGTLDLSPSCAHFEHWAPMLHEANLDGVIVTTPPRIHGPIAAAAIARGMPVLVEKPLTMDHSEAVNLAMLAERLGVCGMVEHTHLFSPAYGAIREEVRAAGPPRRIWTLAGARQPIRADVSVLWDWGPHDVALCSDLCQGPGEVSWTETVERHAICGGEAQTVRIGLALPKGCAAEITLSTLVDKTRLLAVEAADFVWVYDDTAGQKAWRLPRHGWQGCESWSVSDAVLVGGTPIDYRAQAPLAVAIESFGKAIRYGRTEHSSLWFGAEVVGVLAACEGSLTHG